MNLFHLNTGVEDKVLLNADYDIRRYTDFINKSIDFLKRETLAIKVSKTVVEGETRYSPETPTSKKAEKAIELLFNENTKAIFDQKKNFYNDDSIRIDDQNEDENYITLESEIQGDTFYLKPDTYQLEQQKRALDNLRHRPLREHQPLLNLFGFPESRVWQQSFYTKDFTWQILTDETKNGVDEQREFVSKAMQTNDFALMEGPPGSGKTTTIIELIMQYAAEGKRVLLCSATHAAIDNVIERIKGRYKYICDKEIVPVRISRFEKPVKENVRPYLLRNLVSTYKADIEKHLKKNQKLESQKFLLANLYKKEEKEIDPIEKIILDSANLVAGTMIGILQHPDIRANKQGASFDVLIVDEASKVTFSDFIVPALHAKKWILVGDVKQLSPYVENDYVSENIAKMIDEETQNAIVKQFELKSKLDENKFDDCLKVFFTDNPKSEKHLIESHELVVETVEANWEATENNIAKINSADVVIAANDNRTKQVLSESIQVKSIFINGETSSLKQRYRQDYLRKKFPKPLPYLFDSRQEEWSEMVSSRLNQSFSFRNAEGFENIDRELNYLIPSDIQDDINQIKRLVFPSILELLQNGIGKGEGQRNNRVLSDGLHPHYKQSRFVSLTYQHRMHPDIAKTSRDNFYDNNLQSANTVLQDRGWKYALNEPVVKWNFNNDNTGNKRGERIVNPKEADHIENELVKFLRWAKNNPNSTGEKYEVAVLTFYLNQETELRNRIRKITRGEFPLVKEKDKKNSNPFHLFKTDTTDIYLYTVDKFQGQEADLVLLGFTKFTRDAHFNSPNRLNVALTRARHKLILFGNRAWFRERAKLKALRDLATNFESTIRIEK
jgi:hypothetical protein